MSGIDRGHGPDFSKYEKYVSPDLGARYQQKGKHEALQNLKDVGSMVVAKMLRVGHFIKTFCSKHPTEWQSNQKVYEKLDAELNGTTATSIKYIIETRLMKKFKVGSKDYDNFSHLINKANREIDASQQKTVAANLRKMSERTTKQTQTSESAATVFESLRKSDLPQDLRELQAQLEKDYTEAGKLLESGVKLATEDKGDPAKLEAQANTLEQKASSFDRQLTKLEYEDAKAQAKMLVDIYSQNKNPKVRQLGVNLNAELTKYALDEIQDSDLEDNKVLESVKSRSERLNQFNASMEEKFIQITQETRPRSVEVKEVPAHPREEVVVRKAERHVTEEPIVPTRVTPHEKAEKKGVAHVEEHEEVAVSFEERARVKVTPSKDYHEIKDPVARFEAIQHKFEKDLESLIGNAGKQAVQGRPTKFRTNIDKNARLKQFRDQGFADCNTREEVAARMNEVLEAVKTELKSAKLINLGTAGNITGAAQEKVITPLKALLKLHEEAEATSADAEKHAVGFKQLRTTVGVEAAEAGKVRQKEKLVSSELVRRAIPGQVLKQIRENASALSDEFQSELGQLREGQTYEVTLTPAMARRLCQGLPRTVQSSFAEQLTGATIPFQLQQGTIVIDPTKLPVFQVGGKKSLEIAGKEEVEAKPETNLVKAKKLVEPAMEALHEYYDVRMNALREHPALKEADFEFEGKALAAKYATDVESWLDGQRVSNFHYRPTPPDQMTESQFGAYAKAVDKAVGKYVKYLEDDPLHLAALEQKVASFEKAQAALKKEIEDYKEPVVGGEHPRKAQPHLAKALSAVGKNAQKRLADFVEAQGDKLTIRQLDREVGSILADIDRDKAAILRKGHLETYPELLAALPPDSKKIDKLKESYIAEMNGSLKAAEEEAKTDLDELKETFKDHPTASKIVARCVKELQENIEALKGFEIKAKTADDRKELDVEALKGYAAQIGNVIELQKAMSLALINSTRGAAFATQAYREALMPMIGKLDELKSQRPQPLFDIARLTTIRDQFSEKFKASIRELSKGGNLSSRFDQFAGEVLLNVKEAAERMGTADVGGDPIAQLAADEGRFKEVGKRLLTPDDVKALHKQVTDGVAKQVEGEIREFENEMRDLNQHLSTLPPEVGGRLSGFLDFRAHRAMDAMRQAVGKETEEYRSVFEREGTISSDVENWVSAALHNVSEQKAEMQGLTQLVREYTSFVNTASQTREKFLNLAAFGERGKPAPALSRLDATEQRVSEALANIHTPDGISKLKAAIQQGNDLFEDILAAEESSEWVKALGNKDVSELAKAKAKAKYLHHQHVKIDREIETLEAARGSFVEGFKPSTVYGNRINVEIKERIGKLKALKEEFVTEAWGGTKGAHTLDRLTPEQTLAYGEHVDRVISEARQKVEQLLHPAAYAAATLQLNEGLERVKRQIAHYRENKQEHLAAGLEVARQKVESRQTEVSNEKEVANRSDQVKKDVADLEKALVQAKEIDRDVAYFRGGWQKAKNETERDLLKMAYLEETYKGKVGEMADYITIKERVLAKARQDINDTVDPVLQDIDLRLSLLDEMQGKVPTVPLKAVQDGLKKQKAHFEELKTTMTEKGRIRTTKKDLDAMKSAEIKEHIEQVQAETEKALEATGQDVHGFVEAQEAYEDYQAERRVCEQKINELLHPVDGSEPQAVLAKEMAEKLKAVDAFKVAIKGVSLAPLTEALEQAEAQLETLREEIGTRKTEGNLLAQLGKIGENHEFAPTVKAAYINGVRGAVADTRGRFEAEIEAYKKLPMAPSLRGEFEGKMREAMDSLERFRGSTYTRNGMEDVDLSDFTGKELAQFSKDAHLAISAARGSVAQYLVPFSEAVSTLRTMEESQKEALDLSRELAEDHTRVFTRAVHAEEFGETEQLAHPFKMTDAKSLEEFKAVVGNMNVFSNDVVKFRSEVERHKGMTLADQLKEAKRLNLDKRAIEDIERLVADQDTAIKGKEFEIGKLQENLSKKLDAYFKNSAVSEAVDHQLGQEIALGGGSDKDILLRHLDLMRDSKATPEVRLQAANQAVEMMDRALVTERKDIDLNKIHVISLKVLRDNALASIEALRNAVSELRGMQRKLG